MFDHSTPATSNSKVITSVQHEPQLFVPPASPVEVNKASVPTRASPVPSVPSLPPNEAPNFPKSNPYSRAATGGHRPRPMFPSNQQFFQSPSAPPSSASPNTQLPYHGTNPPVPIMELSKTANQPQPESPTVATTTSPSPPPPTTSQFYQPVAPHWFYCKNAERSSMWSPFSLADSSKLELLFQGG